MNFPDNPSGGDLFNGFIYNATLGVWDVATSDGYFAVTASGSSAYVFNGFGTDSDSNPTLYLHRGKTYEFAVDATGHPFYIKTVSGTGTGNAYSDGVTNNGTASGTIKFVVPQDAPSKLYYNCSAHAAMAGEIIIPRAAQIDDLSDVDTSTTAPTDGQVLTWDNANSKWEPASGGIALTDLSVTTNAAGTAALTYSNSTGVFSYTPPDLSSYITSYTVTQSDVTTHQAALSITESQISDLGTYLTGITNESIGDLSDVNSSITGSSNHVLGWDATNSRWDAQVGITPNNVNSYVDSHLNQSSAATNEVLSWNGSDYDWVAQSGGIALTDISVTTNAAGTAALTYSNTTGVFSYTPPDLSSYLTSVALNDISDVTITSASSGQVLKYNGTAWVNAADAGGIALTDLSVTTNAAGTAALSYNNSTGAFTYTPPDLSSYLTGITGQSIEDLSDVNAMTPTDGQVLTWDNANSRWDAASPSGGSYNDASVDTHLNTSTAATNEVLSWNGTDYDWVAQSGGGGASVTTADTAPSSPSDGDLWYDTTTLRLYVYYNDGSSSQWVKANPSGSGSGASVAVQETAPSNPSSGDLWWDTADLIMAVYYSDGDSSQWVQIG
ncbi:MAG: hypothetical protein VW715_02115 [Rhodospirillales bacterium]